MARVDIWEGWSLDIPEGFDVARNPDGSWSAWNEAVAVDVKTISTAGTAAGPLSAEQMLGAPGYRRGWTPVLAFREGQVLGRAYFVREDGPDGETWWLHGEVATTNRKMLCSVGMRDQAQRALAESIVRSVRHSAGADERLA